MCVMRAWIRRCPTVGFHTNRVRPFLDLWLGKPYPILEMENFVAAHGGLLFQRPSDRDKFVVPPSFREVYRNRSWTMYERCGLRA